MAQSGNWIPNLINWLIGYVIMYVWSFLAMLFLNWIGMWQMTLDGVLQVYESSAPTDVSGTWSSTMSVGDGGSWSSSLI